MSGNEIVMVVINVVVVVLALLFILAMIGVVACINPSSNAALEGVVSGCRGSGYWGAGNRDCG